MFWTQNSGFRQTSSDALRIHADVHCMNQNSRHGSDQAPSSTDRINIHGASYTFEGLSIVGFKVTRKGVATRRASYTRHGGTVIH